MSKKKSLHLEDVIKEIGEEKFLQIVEEIDQKYGEGFESDPIPKGWVKFEEKFPSGLDSVNFAINRFLIVKVRDSSRKEFYTQISDVLTWMQYVQPSQDIIEWLNE